jgi:hypothetical protein
MNKLNGVASFFAYISFVVTLHTTEITHNPETTVRPDAMGILITKINQATNLDNHIIQVAIKKKVIQDQYWKAHALLSPTQKTSVATLYDQYKKAARSRPSNNTVSTYFFSMSFYLKLIEIAILRWTPNLGQF